ncbi:hypothetical protein NDU88_002987 [Pleurodeles waltl]|uniref:Uncharacterized protein n=1 Tax=Pleurodeles waltl TaxID=8319 RepID=A0AAV7LFD9_PLEWA|nr:hypothetical protein NDU88_002987 [Pleurodeles waltl]
MKAEPERRPKASERLKRGAETSREKNERKYARNAGRGAGPVKKGSVAPPSWAAVGSTVRISDRRSCRGPLFGHQPAFWAVA